MVIYPLARCLARPQDEKGRHHLLVDHLRTVAEAMGRPDGERGERLCFLAGLLHDAGKTCSPWQDYINTPPQERRSRGVAHSFAGAMLFAVLLKELLENWNPPRREREALLETGLILIYYIYHHHGAIPDTMGDYPPWHGEYTAEDLICCDLDGLFELVGGYFPELGHLQKTAPAELERRLERVAAAWKKWRDVALDHTAGILEQGNPFGAAAGVCLLRNWANHRLIAGDRLHASGVDPRTAVGGTVMPEEAEAVLDKIAVFCAARKEELFREGARDKLLEKRERCRQAALVALSRHGGARLFTLELPTGYGKTLTALSAALAAVAGGLSGRIIYVAPYLSILSQAAAEISEATGLETLVHHHLAALENLPDVGTSAVPLEDTVVDTWLAPVVATTYNQFFRAFFPRRGQHTMRLKGLQDAFVIVDEPQTVASTSWVPFLTMVEAAARELNCRFLFTTATLPETRGGLFELEPVSLGREEALFDRYRVENIGCVDENSLACVVMRAFREKGSAAVILNTIQDAALVYEAVKGLFNEGEKNQLYFLSGRLTPLHKRARLSEIRGVLDEKEPVLVISTQVLEAGVDLSFRVLYRALPLLPSVIQAAGRCNRHGEEKFGTVVLFDFRRGGTDDTRRYVYRDAMQREVTDMLFGAVSTFNESAAGDLIRDYYRECHRRNSHQAALRKIEAAAYGHWGELAGLEPFGPDIPIYGVFVPLLSGELPKTVQRGMRYFEVKGPESLWERYAKRGYIDALNFADRRCFMTLIYQFMVPVPLDVAGEIGEPAANRTLLRLRYPSLYRDAIGLSLAGSSTEPLSEQFI